ncbi:hypothetical protein [Streptomyces buecherae]|uniref:hypothetical protein n=1 Tax=Streptomyces buecherae TaxID=2763006 RepID=UPI003796EC2B
MYVSLPAARAADTARRIVRSALTTWGCTTAQIETAQSVVTELVATSAGPGGHHLQITEHDQAVTLAVGAVPPTRPDPTPPTSPLPRLACQHGATTSTSWATIPTPRPRRSRAACWLAPR